ncbi:hypothetical protein DRE_04308 [Drechslerella stenobrocha 248]|uniref:CFEM domain-containing protein n=1 Tax=Drechslerella stenobrocha 248 TaxID=1043628 RepID=W7IB91_9PEZI|nr:hypothetical protein DRE_04308 [Drechslerella stenobrocha 248]
MKFISTVTAFSVIATISAQGDISLPQCAEPCIENGGSSSNCDATDYACQCSDTAALGAILTCVESTCGPSQVPAIIAAASAICADFGGAQFPEASSSTFAASMSSTNSENAPRASTSKATATSSIRTTYEGGSTTVGQQTPGATSTEVSNGAAKPSMRGGIGPAVAFVGLLAAL